MLASVQEETVGAANGWETERQGEGKAWNIEDENNNERRRERTKKRCKIEVKRIVRIEMEWNKGWL